MKIYFKKDLMQKILEVIQDTKDCMEMINDVNRINQAMSGLRLYGDCATAEKLDWELHQRYPAINAMLDYADLISSLPTLINNTCSQNEIIYKKLEQDYYGILCHIAIKKQIVNDVKECIESVH